MAAAAAAAAAAAVVWVTSATSATSATPVRRWNARRGVRNRRGGPVSELPSELN